MNSEAFPEEVFSSLPFRYKCCPQHPWIMLLVWETSFYTLQVNGLDF